MAKGLSANVEAPSAEPAILTGQTQSRARMGGADVGLDGKRRIILIEFNELCPELLDRWMAEGYLPNFRRFYERSQVFVTEADVSEALYLEPWIQWYSMHTGLAYDQHRVFHLTDGPQAGHTDIWQILLEHGRRVGCCGSMNAQGFTAPGSYFLPDPWCTSEATSPAELDVFYRVVSRAVQEYTNASFRLGLSDYARFATFMLSHGLRPATAWRLARQLLHDRLIDREASWRRAPLLDRLQLDVFRHYERRLRPDFATFFANSTAHYQHAYWRHMEPEAFTVRPGDDELRVYGEAVLFGYRQMDRLLADFFAMEDDDVMLVFATALSQQPFLRGEAQGGHHFYRVRNIERFLSSLGIVYERVCPVMTHQYMVHFADQAAADVARERLARVTCDGCAVFDFNVSEDRTLYFGNGLHLLVPEDAEVTVGEGSNRGWPFYELFYKIDALKSGMHHPDGALWFKTGVHARHPEKVSILDVMPTLLDFFAIAPAAHDATAFRGQSLLSRFGQ